MPKFCQEGLLIVGITPTKLYWDGTVDLGDLIVELEGKPILMLEDLQESIERYSCGDLVSIKALRGEDPKQPKVITEDGGRETNGGRHPAWRLRGRGGGGTSMVSS